MNVPASSTLSFATIRPWAGSQDRAFEELSYQLLKSEAPPGSVAVRAGNPDGGVEWFANLPNGDQWGWQAKNVQGIDALLTAMTESVRRVVIERPHLVKLTFVVSWNLAPGTSGGKRKSQLEKYEDKVSTWRKTIAGAERIDFDLKQESDLLDILARPEHRGRIWFWWGGPTFGISWLESAYRNQAEIAGGKYRPVLQVDLPIGKDLVGLGLSRILVDEFEGLRGRLAKEIRQLRFRGTPDAELTSACQAMVDAAHSVAVEIGTNDSLSEVLQRFPALELTMAACLDSARHVERLAFARRRPFESVGLGDRKVEDELNSIIYVARRLIQALSEMSNWIDSSPSRAAQSRLYFLIGPAGSGKTHLLLDSVRTALNEGRPAIFIRGASFGTNLWASICEEIGLEHVGRDVLLGAMDSAAEASGLAGQRFVIVVDALNESTVGGFWETHLPSLRSAILQWPNLALAVSCRDTYLDIIDPENERQHFVVETHPGFAGRETEATQKYFGHYKLEVPRIPLLAPEFSVPLFLRLYCESLVDAGNSGAPVGHEGRVQIFERYLDSKVDRISRKVFPHAVSSLDLKRNRDQVRRTLDVLLDRLAAAGSEWLDLEEAERLLAPTLGDDCRLVASVIGAFESEGVFTQEPLYLQGQGNGIGIRVTFQAFSDYLLLKRCLERISSPFDDQDFQDWLRDKASWGILEAATVAFPENYKVELPDFLGLDSNDLKWQPGAEQAAHLRTNRARHVFESLAETLPYRTSDSISHRTIDLLNVGLDSEVLGIDLFDMLYAIAPQPDNRLNALGLHRNLCRYSMPSRDAWFGFSVYSKFWDETSPITRLTRWAALGPYPDYPPQVVELAATSLIWLLSSPNRFMRDWVTKALVQLLHDRIDIVRNLVERFWSVDDPYVVQRVMLVAYGSVMRGGESDLAGATALAKWVIDNVFKSPIRSDELLLDAARGIVEWAVAHDALPEDAILGTKRPYGLKLPGNSRTKSQIDARYGYKKDVPDDKSYASIHTSLFGFGDFGRYVVDSHLHSFSRYRHGQAAARRSEREPRFIKSRWEQFLRSLTPEQQSSLETPAESCAAAGLSLLEYEIDVPQHTLLTREQIELLQSCWTMPKPIPSDAYPGERARRWIFMRCLSLGWTPELFGEQDRIIDQRNPGRDEHKAERWGKKYQWMAYHELLARIADNYQTHDYFGDPEQYDGPQQMIGWRDIDPSLPPIDYRALLEVRGEGTRSWMRAPINIPSMVSPRLRFFKYRGDPVLFLSDLDTEPTIENVAMQVDSSGKEWIALYCSETQKENQILLEERSLEQSMALRSYFVASQSDSRDAQKLMAIWRRDWHELDHHGHVDCCFAGEVGWSLRPCNSRSAAWRTIGRNFETVYVLDTSESYRWEGNILDCSIGESASVQLPSRFVFDHALLGMKAEGPSWTNQDGEVVMTYVEDAPDSRTLFARVDWLSTFLEEKNLSLALVGWYERRLRDAESTYRHPHLAAWNAGLMKSSGRLTAVGIPIRATGPDSELPKI